MSCHQDEQLSLSFGITRRLQAHLMKDWLLWHSQLLLTSVALSRPGRPWGIHVFDELCQDLTLVPPECRCCSALQRLRLRSAMRTYMFLPASSAVIKSIGIADF